MGINRYLNAQVPDSCILILNEALTCYLMGVGVSQIVLPGLRLINGVYGPSNPPALRRESGFLTPTS